jgi:hypothetical protein
MNIQEKTITRKEAEKLNMEIWEGNENKWYARIMWNIDRENPLYGYVFTITE